MRTALIRSVWLTLAALPVTVLAANFETRRFEVEIKVHRDRRLEIVETIRVDFTIPQRGLVRTIPFRTQSEVGKRRAIRLELLGAKLDTGSGLSNVPVQQATRGGDWQLRIGDSNRRLVGGATYRIAYRVSDALTDFSERKRGKRTELHWNVIASAWPTSIDRASLKVTFPLAAKGPLVARVLVGARGSREGVQWQRGKDTIGRTDLLAGSLSATTLAAAPKAPLRRGQGMTVILSLPAGTVRPAPPPRPQAKAPAPTAATVPYTKPWSDPKINPTAEFKWPSPSPWGLLLRASLVGLLYFLLSGRLPRKQGPLVVRFDPPEGLGPAEVGTLVDQKVETRDIVAGMVGLAQKGCLRMTPAQDGSRTMILRLLNAPPREPLTPFEGQLLSALRPYGPVVTPYALRGEFGSQYRALEHTLWADLMHRGIFRPGVGAWKGCIGCAFWGLLVLITIRALFSFGTPACLGFILAAVGGSILLGRTTHLTREGSRVRHEALGLKEFISRAHRHELNYMAERAPDQALFERLLPYAMAFGVVKQWVDAFRGIDIAPPDWIDDTTFADVLWFDFLADSLVHMGHDYSEAMTYAPAPAPSSTDSDGTTIFGSGSVFSSGESGFGSDEDHSGGFGGFDSSSGSFDSGGGVDSGAGGGGGDSW